LEHEISKYTVSGLKKITAEAIREISPDTHENDIWELIEALNSSTKQVEAISILENLFQSNTDAYYIIAMLVRNLRQMILVKDMTESGFDSKEICSKLRIPPFTLPQIKSASSKYTTKALIDLYEKITNMDFETKIGNIEPKVGLTLMLVLFEKYLTR
jgi:DNA polymerase-3 subunit delta